MDYVRPANPLASVRSPAQGNQVSSVLPPAPAAPVALGASRRNAPLVDLQYGIDEEEEEEIQPVPAPIPNSLQNQEPQPDIDNHAEAIQPDRDPWTEEERVHSDWEMDGDDEADHGQIGGARVLKRIKFNEEECRRLFNDALLCKTYTPVDYYADLNTVLFSFRDVIQREMAPIVAFHPGVKAWITLTNLYDYEGKRVDKEVSIKTAPLYIRSEAGIDDLIVNK